MAGGLQEKNLNEKREFSLKSLLVGSVIAAAAAALLAGAFAALSRPSRRLERLEVWEYASSSEQSPSGLEADEWKQSDGEHPVSREKGDVWLFLRGTLPAEASGQVYVELSGGSCRITVGGETVYDTLTDGPVLTAARAVSFPVEAPGGEVEITAYVPFSDHVSVYFSQQGDPFPSYWIMPDLDVLLAASLLLAGVLWLLWMRGRRKLYRRGETLLSLILWAAAAAVFQERIGGGFPSLRVQNACILLAYTGCMAHYLLKLSGWQRSAENLAAINVLYGVCILILPYPELLAVLLRIGVLLQIADGGYLFWRTGTVRTAWNSRFMALALIMTAANLTYWYRLAVGSLEGSLALWLAGVLVYGTGGILFSRKTKKEMAGKGGGSETSGSEKGGLSGTPGSEKGGGSETPDEGKQEPLGIVYTGLKAGGPAAETVRKALEEKGLGIHGHGLRVAEYTLAICHAMRMGQERARMIGDAALLHDMGKVVIPRALLEKKKLTDSEFEQIRAHILYGYDLLWDGEDPFAVLAAKIAKEHHERVDGSGYLGLKGDDICLEARIVSVADVFDALTSERAYKQTWSFESGFQYILEHKETYFDADVTDAFCKARERIREIYDVYQSREQTGSERT